MKVKLAIKNLEVLKDSYDSAVSRVKLNVEKGDKIAANKYMESALGILLQINKIESMNLK